MAQIEIAGAGYSVSSPITRRVYNLGLDEFIAWYMQEPRPAGFTKAIVTAWRVALEARGLEPISINVRITAVRKLGVEAADNGLLAVALRGASPPQSPSGGSASGRDPATAVTLDSRAAPDHGRRAAAMILCAGDGRVRSGDVGGHQNENLKGF